MAKATLGRVFAIAIFVAFFVGLFVIVTQEDKPAVPPGPYQLQFSDKFNAAVATQDDLGISIMLAIDVSGSMGDTPASGGPEKYKIAADSLAEIVSFLQKFRQDNPDIKLKIGLLRFSDTPETLFELQDATGTALAKLRQLARNANNFLPTGGTAIGLTMEAATEALMQSGTLFKSLIVVTDGENTVGVNPATVFGAMLANRNNKTNDSFGVSTNSIITSFVAFDQDQGTFSPLAKLGARVTTADDSATLNASLKDIFVADITKLEAGK